MYEPTETIKKDREEVAKRKEAQKKAERKSAFITAGIILLVIAVIYFAVK
ncbi:hypothetical protein [Stenotrophomonas phage BUCT627]|uniref:Uncharacterized protein n=1 Tax=Stenotrophomonas phage BUCT627 TaxID=2860377 RepID=A0AC61NGF5_9CAUD|nr:hypothetical protein PQD77_gp029 [Stenotrophomonas phage BUCT627]QYC96635.1 hypothetical protein [Stenotrophomonas phage BUCT627]